MCDAKATRFFRPWNISEPMRKGMESAEEAGASPSFIKVEEDNESVLSTSTCEESSAASFSENEASRGAMSERRRRRRRRSESSADTSTRSCSVNSEEHVEGSSLDMLSNFVFNSQPVPDYPVTPTALKAASAIPEDASFSARTDYAAVAPAYPVDYLQRMPQQRVAGFAPLGEASPCLSGTSMEASALQASTTSTMGQNFYYGFPSVHQFSRGLYASSMEEAVELIHRQDAVAKQMKKLRPKKFRCEHCDVAFSNNGQLKGHIRIHTGERPFKCDAEGCGKSFTRNEELTRHKRIHTGLRPHSCVLCGKRFGRKDHLKKHTRTHDSRDPYRMSAAAAALGVFALGHTLPHAHPLPPYVYPI